MKLVRSIAPFLFLAGIVIILFYKIIFLGQVFYEGFDNLHLIIPGKYVLLNTFKQGIFPLWNPYLFTGIPYIADITNGTFSIFTLFYLLFQPDRAVALLTPLLIFLFGSGMYLFLRSLKMSQMASLFGGIVFILAGSIFDNVHALDSLTIIVYIPFLFLLVHRFLAKKKLKYFLFLIFLQSLQILSGHPRVTYYTIFFISFFLLFWSTIPLKKRILIIFLYWAGSLLLAAIQMIPFAEYTFFSNRPFSSFAFASSGALGIANVITSFFPTFFGTHINGSWWGPQVMLFGYLSVPGYITLWFGIKKGKLDRKSFYVVSLVLSFLLSIGKFSPVYILFYYIVPTWRLFRDPIDIMVLCTFFATVLAASGMEHLAKEPKGFNKFARYLLLPLTILSVCLSIVYTFFNKYSYIWINAISSISNHAHFLHLGRLLIYDSKKLQVMFQGMLGNVALFFIFFTITILIFLYTSRRKLLLSLFIILFTSFTFIYFDMNEVTTSSPKFLTVGNSVPELLQDAQNGTYRIISMPVDLHQQREHLAIPDYFYQETIAMEKIYANALNVRYGLYQANATATLIPQSLATFVEGNGRQLVDVINFSHILPQQLNLLSVKYIISYEPLPSSYTYLKLILAKPHTMYLYENPFAYKRAYLIDNPLGSDVQIVKDTSQRITVRAFSLKPTHLIISDLYYPGWIATVNGKNAPIQPYKNTFQMIALPKGNSIIILSYQPKSFLVGLWISLSAFFMWILLFLFLRKKTL